MTRFALAGNCVGLGRRGSATACAPASSPKPTMPKPAPMVLSSSRLVMLIHPLEFICVQQQARVLVPVALLHKLEPQLHFLRRRLPPVENAICLDCALVIRSRQPLHQPRGLLFYKAAVHHEQAL